MKFGLLCAAAVLALTVTSNARAELAVSINDGKQVQPGDDPPGPTDDTVSVLELGHYPPRVIGEVKAPGSMIGPPDAVAVAPDESFAIVTDSQKFDPANPTKLIPNDQVSVIDLATPSNPKLVQTVEAGPGASGVSMNKSATLALVASTGDGTVTVFSIDHKRLTQVGKVQFDPETRLTDVVFTPNGSKALVMNQTKGSIVELSVNGTTVMKNGIEISLNGGHPYGGVVTPDGNYEINAGGAPLGPQPAPSGLGQPRDPRTGYISLVDLRSNTVVDTAEVGPTPEHVVLSADGNYVAVTVANGAATNKLAPTWNTVHGLLKVFAVRGPRLALVASASIGHWGQGATWTNDGHTILLQCAGEREIEVFHFDGASLTRDDQATLTFRGRPGSISTARSR